MKFFIITLILTISSCNSSTSYENYAAMLIRCSEPGDYCRIYLNELQDQHPLFLLKKAYDDISDRWEHTDDQPGFDYPIDAEKLFRTRKFTGDCEDKSVLLMAIARELGLRARFCLATSKSNKVGHIWIEILLCNSTSVLINELSTFKNAFPNETIIFENDYIWLGLINKNYAQEYIPEYYVNVYN